MLSALSLGELNDLGGVRAIERPDRALCHLSKVRPRHSIISKLGGPQKVAAALNLPFTTVSSWSQRNAIPDWRIGPVAELARKEGVAMPADFGPRRDAAA